MQISLAPYEKELVQTDPVHVCCSCEQLHKRRNVSQVSFSDTELGTDVWPRLKALILERDETASKQVYVQLLQTKASRLIKCLHGVCLMGWKQ